jgi:hypothetical protein
MEHAGRGERLENSGVPDQEPVPALLLLLLAAVDARIVISTSRLGRRHGPPGLLRDWRPFGVVVVTVTVTSGAGSRILWPGRGLSSLRLRLGSVVVRLPVLVLAPLQDVVVDRQDRIPVNVHARRRPFAPRPSSGLGGGAGRFGIFGNGRRAEAIVEAAVLVVRRFFFTFRRGRCQLRFRRAFVRICPPQRRSLGIGHRQCCRCDHVRDATTTAVL